MTEAPHLLVNEDDGILVATFHRPDKLNAMSTQLMRGLESAVEHLRDTPALKVMLIRATGRYFSAGADSEEALSQEASRPTCPPTRPPPSNAWPTVRSC
jgi:enoyl-CoA hydratase/carnithine racemase